MTISQVLIYGAAKSTWVDWYLWLMSSLEAMHWCQRTEMLWGGMPNWVMWMAPEGHGNNLAWVAAKNYGCGRGFDTVRICVQVPGPCCCQGPHECPQSESHLMAMLVSEGCHHCQCQRDLGAQCCQGGHGIIQTTAAAKNNIWVCGPAEFSLCWRL